MQYEQSAALNRRNEAFWREQSDNALRRMKDPELLETALADLIPKIADCEGIRRQKTLEQALEDAECGRKRLNSQRAQKAGRSKKSDPLHLFIENAALKNRKITFSELKLQLEQASGTGRTFEIVDGSIEFTLPSGRERTTPIAALKHRLSRIKKKLKKH